MAKYNYEIRYGLLEPNLIFNECGPFSGGPAGWDEESIAKREAQGLRNIEQTNEHRNGFFDKLEASVLKDGFRNPILVLAGFCPLTRDRGVNPRLPLEMQEDHSKILLCNQNGGSRLWVAQTHNLKIPCIISDFVEMFPDMDIVEKDLQAIKDCYQDQPERVWVHSDGVRIRRLPQIT